MKRVLNILYQSDDNYAPVMGVSLTSLFENNKDIEEINVYILNDDISEENLKKIKMLCTSYSRNASILGVEPIKERVKQLNVTAWRGKYTAWLKVFAINMLDLPTDQVLYIDCDTIINGSLASLCDFELGDCIMAMSCDCVLNEYKKIIGIPANERYFNVGVILFGQDKWISEKCEEEIIAHLRHNRYYLPEQDVLSVLYRNRTKKLDITYNINSGFYIYGIEESYRLYDLEPEFFYEDEEVRNAYDNPVIHHCMGTVTGRPWEKNNTHPLSSLFDEYLALSPWHNHEKAKVRFELIFAFQKALYKILPMKMYIYVHKFVLERYLRKMDKAAMVGNI